MPSVPSRRRFFGALFAGAAAGAAVTTAAAQPAPGLAALPGQLAPYQYLDYEIHFTGYKPSYESNLYQGQWLAWPIRRSADPTPDEQPYLYVNVPGMIGGPFQPGSVFNLVSRNRHVSAATSEVDRQAYVAEGRTYIEQLVRLFHQTTAERAYYGLYTFPFDQHTRFQLERAPSPVFGFGFTGFEPPRG